MSKLDPAFAHKQARKVLAECEAPLGGDYDTLPNAAVYCLVQHMALQRYRKPKNANGSAGRYFHDMLQRRARLTAGEPGKVQP